MPTFHLHIEGRVQGVGFRPHVYSVAHELGMRGQVRNDPDGVHVVFVADDTRLAQQFADQIIDRAPALARIKEHALQRVEDAQFDGFEIAESEITGSVRLLVTPDFALCSNCKKELFNPEDRRYRYPFITCTQCGPRYSIISGLPYDRPKTTMAEFVMCPACLAEYNDPLDRRHFSQTNSCPACPVSLLVYDRSGQILFEDQEEILAQVIEWLNQGNILAVKGIGGYVLMCDATDADVINRLRKHKGRPAKPFAVMYPSVEMMREDLYVDDLAEKLLHQPESPILLLRTKDAIQSGLCREEIAPGLNMIGAMIPYTGLYELILGELRRPLIVTSGNISDSPIVYRDEEALDKLLGIANYVVTNDREIVLPQDDSVVRCAKAGDVNRSIVIRRSRGMAPSVDDNALSPWDSSVLTMGSDLKSSLGIHQHGQLYISQYLGDLSREGSRESYRHTLEHMQNLLRFTPDKIVIDKHPAYHSSRLGRQLAGVLNVPVITAQHHLAHFAAVLAENDLLNGRERILGAVFDGTGYGDDGNIWGGEFFIHEGGKFSRAGHLAYFDHILGDKMAREPRISAFALCREVEGAPQILRSKFTQSEWRVYRSMRKGALRSSSMGRVFDAVASIIGLADIMSYEGEAAMYLECHASSSPHIESGAHKGYPFDLTANNRLDLMPALQEIVNDVLAGKETSDIAFGFHLTVARAIIAVAQRLNAGSVALSGGVFQNALLVDLCHRVAGDKIRVFTHRNLSPNDENIAFGQLALAYIDDLVGKATPE